MKTQTKEQRSPIPFIDTYDHYTKQLGMSSIDAINSIQEYYQQFKYRNERLLERQVDLSNSAQIGLINQSSLISSATLTFTGALVVLSNNFTNLHVFLLMLVIILELLSLTLALFDYRFTARFHNLWARAYHKIDLGADEGIDDGSLNNFEALRKLETKNTDILPGSTNMLITNLMWIFSLTGLWLFALLVFAYYFDVPLV